MALLTLDERKAIFKELGLGEYNKANILAFQKKYMLRKSDYDGIYGNNTDNTLRTVYYTKTYTKNFSPKEFVCECGGKYCCGYPSYMKPAELIHIQSIRDHYGKPITITSGLRCKTWNKKCGGSIQNSLHMSGLALDFYQSGVTDTLKNRKASIKWIKKQPNQHYTYGNGINSYGNGVSAPYMGNALHTDCFDKVEPKHPKWVEEKPAETKPSDAVSEAIKPPYKVIDVSDWQDKIDWAKVKADGVVGAIIRYADGTTLDKRFAENMKNAKAAGLHIGSYIFSRAKTKAQAEKEAERLFNACKPYGCDMPLYIDLEVSSLSKYADTVAIAFLTKMKALGGRGGVYANLNWWNNYLKKTAKDYSSNPFWIAQYNKTMDYKPKDRMGMWQYSSSGKVNGISGKVDMDECYVTYWNASVKPSEPSEEPKPSEPTETTTPTKTIAELAQEVLDGKWGSGQARKDNLTKAGFDYDAVQAKVNEILYERLSEREKTILKGNEWARKIAADNRYHYNKWNGKDNQTKLCPICSGVDYKSDPKHFGWNCIGAAFAVWHHGMGLPCKCNCSVISNGIGEKMNKMTDAKALKTAQERIGMKNIAVIRNNGKNVPQSQWQAGDIMLTFSGDTYTHMWYYMGDGELFEAQGSDGKVANDDQVRIASAKKRTSRIIIRWLG